MFDGWVKNGLNGYTCKLDPEEWAEKIIMASQIDDATMEKASEEVLSAASAEVIDQEYYERIRAIAESGSRQEQ